MSGPSPAAEDCCPPKAANFAQRDTHPRGCGCLGCAQVRARALAKVGSGVTSIAALVTTAAAQNA